MGVEVYLDLEKEVEGMSYPLTKISMVTEMDEVTAKLSLTPLFDSFSANEELQTEYRGNYGMSREQALEAGFSLEEYEELNLGLEQVRPEMWLPAVQGLKTVRGLLHHLRNHPFVLNGQEHYVVYLEEVEALLQNAQKQAIGFHFTAAAS